MLYTEKFVNYYEKLGWNEFSFDFYNTLKKYFPSSGFNYLDVACGTGVLAARVAKIKRAKVDAFDISPAMIKSAKQKSKKVNFFIADMTQFKNENQYDLISCLYDSINCLKGLNQWGKFFKNMHSSLKKNGFFIFDYNNLKAKKNWQKRYETNIDGYKIVYTGKPVKDGAKLNLNIFFDGKKILEEKFVNYMYTDGDIKKILKRIGFKIIRQNKNKFKTRNFVFCRK